MSYFSIQPSKLRKTTYNLSQYSQPTDQDSNMDLPKYETVVPTVAEHYVFQEMKKENVSLIPCIC
jgi:hypothetical protein